MTIHDAVAPRVDAGSRSETTLFVCSTCKRLGEPVADGAPKPGRLLADALLALEQNHGFDHSRVRVVPVECLSNCNAGCTVAIAGAGKWTYVVGRLEAGRDEADVLAFARLHAAHPSGTPAWRERPEIGRKNVVARIPPLPLNESEPTP